MLKIKVWTKEGRIVELRNLRPRSYMCGWRFEQLVNYTKDELYWKEIEVEDITQFEIVNETQHWRQAIKVSA